MNATATGTEAEDTTNSATVRTTERIRARAWQPRRLTGCGHRLSTPWPGSWPTPACPTRCWSTWPVRRSPPATRVRRAPGRRLSAAPCCSPVINATGVLLHTNLGRAPMAVTVPAAYTNLELDLATGQRGSRHGHAAGLLARAAGAEAALVVNNGAAAVLLVLAALARGQSVAVSRGELVEIGGGFRVPEVMAQSGARLVEVGTTNRTRLADYAAADAAARAQGAPVELPHRGLHRGGRRRRAGPRSGRPSSPTSARVCSTRPPRGWPTARPAGWPGSRRRARRSRPAPRW